ncbi:non-ribosomal peptide synthetase, partial [Rhodococcus sp. UNC363MFTsu5.1]|uniref:non-ribosomal peptide synthetase n=1 Tax=Rhodococcus sp. UNC363MFTsu5.1 TaxID=1449069 RepID=UPI00056C9D4C
GPLLYGGTLVVVDYYTSRSPEQFLELLARERVTVLNQTPSAFYQLAEADRQSGAELSLRYVVFGGEALELRRLSDWYDRHPDTAPTLVNMYGITETTVHVSYREIDAQTAAAASASIVGQAIDGLRVYVLDGRLQPAPVGVPGEMYVAGVQLARGYLGQPALSSARFVANPFDADGSALYRSGDLARWNASGELEYLGRADDQVKVRGFRIELGEIEAAVLAQESVGQAAVIVREDTSGNPTLVAYVVPSGSGLDVSAVRDGAATALPEYMVPSAFVVLDEIPLTANGKLDRKALPAPVFEAREYRAPSTPAEEIVAGVFAEVLGLDRVGLDDDFFELGGNSLIAAQVVARIGAALDAKVPVRVLFEASTVAAVAAVVDGLAGSGARPALVAQARPEQLPLSLAQRRMWFLNRFDTASSINNIPMAIRLSGRLDVEAMEAALADVIARHESLRTRYPETADGPIQVIEAPEAVAGALVPVRVGSEELLERLYELGTTQFDVTVEVPVRIRLFQVDEAGTDGTEFVLAAVVHHIAADGASIAPFVRDIMTAYTARRAGEAPGWSELPVQYADYALWQREVLGSEDDPQSTISRQLDYWRGELAGLPAQLDVPGDRPRPAVATNKGQTRRFELEPALLARLDAVAKANNTSLFMVMHAAAAVLLARLSGTSDIAIGTPIAGRGEAAVDDVVGMFVNTLVLRTEVDTAESFAGLLARVRANDLGAFANADVPFERLVEVLNPARSQARHPLFQFAMFFQNHAQSAVELPELSVSALDFDPEVAKFDLQWTFVETPAAAGVAAGMSVALTYATDLFDEATAMESFGHRLVRVLDAVAAAPERPVGDFTLLEARELERVLVDWNDSAHPVDAGELLLDAFDRQVAVSPDAVAVTYEGESLTYAELADRVNRLARLLIAQGVGPESLVALAVRRSLDLVVGMYAVLEAGGAYVPVDPDHPVDRIGHILDTAAPVCVLTAAREGFEVPGDRSVLCIDTVDVSAYSPAPVTDADRVGVLRPDHPAYVIFTSGSTGKPKGVAVPHVAIVNQVAWMQAEYGFESADVYLQKTATTFDVSLWGYFIPLRVGAHLVVATPDGHRDPGYVAETIRDLGVTITDFVPSMLTVFSDVVSADLRAAATSGAAGTGLNSLRHVFAIGEALPAETVHSFEGITGARLHNLYGPTEAAVSITYADVTGTAASGSVSIGRPEWNSQVFVLDSRLRPVPVGVPGELYLGGVQLARGYYGRVDLTSDRFVANPFSATGERMYRTGDLVTWDATGELNYIGRTDFQVKFRGQRIELGEIETALLAHPAISQSVAVVASTPTGDQLVGYVVPSAGADVDVDELRCSLGDALPAYMVPAALMVLDAFPLNASGKLDRKALPAPVFESRTFRAPTTPVEQAVADVFAEVLGAQQVGLDDDFFELGGNSLVATQLMARLGAALDTRVPVRELFEASTVAALAARLQVHAGAGGRVELTARPRPEAIPLSLAQQRMWFINQFDTTSAASNIPVAVRLTGDLDVDALQAAIGDLIARHEVLRTVYPALDGTGHQVILPASSAALELTTVEVGEDEVLERVVAVATEGFDVTAAVPVRAALFTVAGTDEHVLVLVVHHIAGDGFSIRPLTRDVMVAYAARAAGEMPGWEPLAVQYADFALWQREALGSESDPDSLIAQQISYWKQTLEDVPVQLDLPADRARPMVASHVGDTVEFGIDVDLHHGLIELARNHNSTMFMVLHSALAVLMARLSGTEDIAIGTPVAGRGEAALDDLVGMFVNTLVLRTEVAPAQSFAEFLAATREVDLSAFANADVPFERLVEVLSPERSQSRTPLFQVALSMQNMGQTSLELPGLRVEALDVDPKVARLDLQVNLSETFDGEGAPTGVRGSFTYATDLFDAATIEAFIARFVRVLESVVSGADAPVGDIEILSRVERAELAARIGAGETEPQTLPELLAAAADRDPSADALVADGRSLTYRELDEQSSRLARALIGRGAGPESVVAMALPRSVESVLAIWAIAKTGAAYVPIDPSYPADRIEHMVSDSEVVVGVTAAPFVAALPDSVQWLDLDDSDFVAQLSELSPAAITDADRIVPVRLGQPAWVIYTSGSTGKPKGVVVTHVGLADFVEFQRRATLVTPESRVLHFASPSFDISINEMLLAAMAGACLVIAPTTIYGGTELADLLRGERVTHAMMTPTTLSSVDPSGLPDLGMIGVGGEACTPDLVARWGGDREFLNGYGPTETTIVVSFTEPMIPGQPITIGKPVCGVRALVLDTRMQPVPDGVVGELYIGGSSLARGYRGRPDLTSDRFVADPFGEPGGRMYRTGDLVRWTDNGELDYVGRSDFQVKVRGFRVELGEVDSLLTAQPGIEFAVTMGHSGAGGVSTLVSYVLAEDGVAVDVDALKSVLEQSLAQHMVPSVIMVLDEVPRTPVGKLDRKALPAPVFAAKAYRAPTNEVEEAVASTFADVLGIERVGLDDDFFELGGNSLIATQVTARLGVSLNATVPVRTLFDASTVEALALAVAQYVGTGARPALVAQERPETIPLSLAQQRMWFLNRMDPESAAYNIPVAIRLTGDLDIASLQAAVVDVLERHESLRTLYPEVDGDPQQVIVPAAQAVPDLTPVAVTEAEILDRVVALMSAPFDVVAEVPLRAALFATGERDYVLVLSVHHISADGWSIAPLTRDVMVAYESRRAGMPGPDWSPLPVQYADFALWQRGMLGAEDDPESLISRQLDYWRGALDGVPGLLELPTDRSRPAIASNRGATVSVQIGRDLRAGIERVAREQGVTEFMVVHAALAVLLARLSGTEDIAIGAPIAGRGEAVLDDLVGMFVNTVVLRAKVEAAESFAALVARVRDTDVTAFGHADVPFERLVDAISPVRSQAHSPLFQVSLTFQNLARTELELPGLTVAGLDANMVVAKFDLDFTMSDRLDADGRVDGMDAFVTYATDLFDEETVRAYTDGLVAVLEQVTGDVDRVVGDLELVSESDLQRTLHDWNATDAVVRQGTLVEWIDESARRFATNPSVSFDGITHGAGEFDARVNRLARLLISRGVGPESTVVVAARRSVEMLTAMFAVVKAGGAFVPADPDQPADRLATVFEIADPVCVMTTSVDGVEVPAGLAVVEIDRVDVSDFAETPVRDAERAAPLRPENPAYVIFTSGSTGVPKGVSVPHAAIVNQLSWFVDEYAVTADDVVLQKTPVVFDPSVWELFVPFLAGAHLVIARPDGHRDPRYLVEVCREWGVTLLGFVPSMLATLVSEPELALPPTVRALQLAGEALSPELAARAVAASDVRLNNAYGPAETTLTSVHHWCDGSETEAMPIGRGVWNMKVYLLDSRLHPVPVGVAGEIYLAGAQVSRGYHGRSDRTAERFVANPFDDGGSVMYRTGDLARWDRRGELEYLGRTDFQVKLRGQRIELGEIESALERISSVTQAVVVLHAGAATGDQLVAYVVAPGAVGADLRAQVATTLPGYMVPATVMVLDELPLNTSGKLDRKLLPAPVFEARAFRAPATATEQTVAAVVGEVLGIEEVGLDDDFFELGGNSLLAMRLVSRIDAALGCTLAVREVFEDATVAGLAARAEATVGAARGIALAARTRPDRIPLSLAQNRMWFLNQFDPSSSAYTVPLAISLRGRLDVEALGGAVRDVLERHESLRTVFPADEQGPAQVILSADQVVLDLEPLDTPAHEVPERVIEILGAGFDVSAQVPVRGALLRTGDDEHVLVMAIHHISTDGVSTGPLARDLTLAYVARAAGQAPAWAPLQVQYADFTLWQLERLGSEEDPKSLAAGQIEFWKDTLAGVPDVLELPTDRPRPAVASGRGARLPFEIDPEIVTGIEALAREHGVTTFMVVHAAYAVLLARLSGGTDIAVGTPIAGRSDAALDDLVGMFVNTLVLRTEVDSSASFGDLLGKVRAADLAAFGHAEIPFERLVEVLNPARSQSHSPLFQASMTFEVNEDSTLELPGLTISGVDYEVDSSQFDLTLIITEGVEVGGRPGGMAAALRYATDLFDGATIESFAQRLVRILSAVIAAPQALVGDLDLLGDAEREQVLFDWNATDELVAPQTLVDLFDRQVTATPAAVALTFDGESLTYAEFSARARQVARHLISIGVGPESLVALAARRSFDLLVGIYAVLEAGGAYVPIDPDQPADRIGHILDTADPVCVLTTTRDGFEAPGDRSVLAIDALDLSGLDAAPVTDAERLGVLTPSNTAYVIFTSGSTGRPKGVAVSHGAIVNRLLWMQAEYGLDADDAVLQKTPVTFDVSVWELFWPLQVGARLVIAVPDGHRDPAYLAKVIVDESVTTAHFVPSMLALFVAEPSVAQSRSLVRVFASGEALPALTADRLREVAPQARLHNLYGPTEAAVDVTFHEVTEADRVSVPIGAPVWNTQVFVLDARLLPVPLGVAGELYLAGDQLARGYVGRPDLSADRFVANPFVPGQRMYRTGDLVRWILAVDTSTGEATGGELEYLGRTDFQVKLRGLRIELGEIETALLALPAIEQSVVTLYRDERGEESLVGYVVPAADATVDLDEVKAALRAGLPAYMVPATFVVLDAFPLNASGKLDRKALPAPVLQARQFRAPSTPTEEIVATVFADVLGTTRIGADDDFFELGGNSLIATQVTARLGAALDTTVSVRTLFDASTVAMLAAAVAAHAGEGARPALVAGERPDELPLSLAQQRMWFLNRFDPESAAYHIPMAIRLTGELDTAALQAAVADVLARHESLRTVFPEVDGAPQQVIVPAAQAVPDLTPVSIAESEVFERVATLVTTPFDVTSGVPLRGALFLVGQDEYVLVLVVHHISADGWSIAPLTRDVMVAYAARSVGQSPDWAPLPVQYADFALWQRDVLGVESDPASLVSRQVGYWTQTLAGLPDLIELPTDRPRPAIASNRGAKLVFEIDAEVHRGVERIAREHAVTQFMVVHAALAVLLARLSGGTDIAIGAPVAGRGEALLDDLVGMFVNTLVLRTEVDPTAGFGAFLAEVRDRDLAAFGHADVPFERIVDAISPVRSQSHSPLFQVALTFQNLAKTELDLPGLHVAGLDIDAVVTWFDLDFTMVDRYDEDGAPSGLTAQLTYAVDLFDADTAEAIAATFGRILAEVVRDVETPVGDIELLSNAERVTVLESWNDTEVEVAPATLVDLVDTQVALRPDAVAVIFEGTELTYAQFDARVNRLARWLVAEGVGPETRVGLAIPRSIEMLAGMHAIVKAGAAYVPIDPDQPVERNAYVVESAAPLLVLTAGAPVTLDVRTEDIAALDLSGYDDAPVRDEERTAPLRPAHPAYVLYTSGSTGRPKGVTVSHAAIVNQMRWLEGEYDVTDADCVMQRAPFTFDVSVWECFLPLCVGARLVIARPGGHLDMGYLAGLMREYGVSIAEFVPSVIAAMVAEGHAEALASLRHLHSGGEALSAELVDTVRAHFHGGLHNTYGPTEAAITTTGHEITGPVDGIVPIGGPAWNTRAYVLDERLHPVQAGVPGELYLAGAQLARGYHGRVDLTSDRFVADPFATAGSSSEPGARMYRTGDLVRWNELGELVYLGRTDFQVKLRGLRIELGEIESALMRSDAVTQSIVTMVRDPRAGEHLVGYVTVRAGTAPAAAELRAVVAAELPAYMVPSQVLVLDEFPVTSSGKVDRKALPAPVFEAAEFRAPVTEVERVVASVFGELLGLERVGLDDDFFALGGNSLIAMQVAARLSSALDARVAVRELFEASTVEALAARLASSAGAGGHVALTVWERPERIPLSPAQSRMWFLNRFDSSSSAYNIPIVVRLSGVLDVEALQAAVADVVARHEVLRTVYVDVDGIGHQVVLPADQARIDLTPVAASAESVAGAAIEFIAAPFDVTEQVPLRARLYEVEAGAEYVLAMTVHHISADGWSVAPLTRDVMVAYAARSAGAQPGWAPLPVQYVDYTLWQREVLGSEQDPQSLVSEQLAYWTEALRGAPEVLELPMDRPRPA